MSNPVHGAGNQTVGPVEVDGGDIVNSELPPAPTTGLITMEQEKFVSIIVDQGYLREDVLAVARVEKRPVDEGFMIELQDAVDSTKLPLAVIVRAVEQGLKLEHVVVAHDALKSLNEDDSLGARLVSSRDLESGLSKVEMGGERYNQLVSADARHRASCVSIDDAILGKFIDTFGLDQDGPALAKAIRRVYRVGDHDRVDVALENALQANKLLPDYKRGQLEEVLDLMAGLTKTRRNIAHAADLQNVGLQGEKSVVVNEEDLM